MSRIIFWDNDGVLVDTEPLFFQATAEVLAERGVQLTEATFKDLSLTQGRSVFDMLDDSANQEERLRMRDRRNDRFTELLGQGDHLIRGAREVLTELGGRHRMAVVTSCRPEHFAVVHQRTGLRPLFEFVLALHDYPRAKPHPDPFLTALERAGVGADGAVVIEDSPRGVQGAVTAGIPCLAIPRGLTRDGDFSGAAEILGDISEVPAAISRLD